MTPFILILSALLLTAGLIWAFRRATRNSSKLLDIPNERSSHGAPVTRGAGIGIVIAVIALYAAVAGESMNLGFVIAALAIALVSFLDDLYSLPLLLRLGVHFGAASFFVFSSGTFDGLAVPFLGYSIQFGRLASVVTVVFIVWVINAFNFMDGIDGIGGAQAAGASLGWMLIGMTTGVASYTTLGALVLGSCIGFLIFNWQPAKVFMGDVGSTFLGFTFAAFPLTDPSGASTLGGSAIAYVVVFLWLFLFDSAFTRLDQLIRLQPFWRPHRDHLYQRIVAAGASHARVAAYFGAVAAGLAVTTFFSATVGPWPLVLLLVLGPSLLLFWKKVSTSV